MNKRTIWLEVIIGAVIRIDPKDPRRLFYLDRYDYRRRRSRAMVPGCALITIYLRKELRASEQPVGDFRAQLDLAMAA